MEWRVKRGGGDPCPLKRLIKLKGLEGEGCVVLSSSE